MRDLLGHLRIALRGLGRRRTLSAASVLTLALGIGTSAALLAVFDAAVRAPLRHVPQVDRLINVRGGLYPADFLAWREAGTSFAAFGAYLPLGAVSWSGEGPPRRLSRFLVTGDYFAAWGARPHLGRAVEPADTAPGATPVAVLAYAFWHGSLGADPTVIGRRLTLDGVAHEVVGVLARGFVVRGGEPELFLPLRLGPAAANDRSNGHLGAVARLRPGATIEQARAELLAATARLADAGVFGTNAPPRPILRPMQQVMRGPQGVFGLLGAAVAALLALVAIDTAQLQLAVARGRMHEMSIRACLGATRGRRAAQVFVETALLAAAAIPLGMLFAAGILRLLPNLGGRITYQAVPPGLGLRVVGLAAGTIMLVAFVAACAPAWLAARARPDHRAGGARRQGQGGRWLVVAQIAVAFVLLTGAGLLIRGTARLLEVDLGYEPGALLKAEVTLPAKRYPTAEAIASFYPRALEALLAQPGVTRAAAAMFAPGGGWGFRPAVDGDETVPREARPPARFVAATPGYEATVGLRQLAGRALSDRDRATGPPVAVISQTAADRLFGVASSPAGAIGHRLTLEGRWLEVVGVVSDVRPDPLSEPDATVYVPHVQLADALLAADLRTMVFVARGASGAESLAGPVREAIAGVDDALPLAAVATLEERALTQLLGPRLQRLVLLMLAGLGLSLGALGLYGLLRADVRARQRELGVRMALGARRADVLAMVLRGGLRLALIGLSAGAALAWIAGRLLANAFWGIPPYDPRTWLAVAALVVLVTLGAAWFPARRATRVDPMTVLRAE